MSLLAPRSWATDNEPPAFRSELQNHATLLVSWWCTVFALFIILTRLGGRYVRTERLFAEDKVMALAIIPLLIRMALAHVVLLYGTNNVQTAGLDAEEVRRRSIGARLVLPARIFYAMYIWVAKFTVSEFLKRVTSNTWSKKQERILQGIRYFLIVTFIGVVIGTLAECQPFDNYWQVIPDPGPHCRNAFVQLLMMGCSDIITDILLIVFPVPIILRSSMPKRQKVSLVLLFGLSVANIAITAYRMPRIISTHGRQQQRTLWASLEILAATAVSNALILGSFLRDRGVKKAKYRGGELERTASADQPSINRQMTRHHWGSDEDLFRSLGCRVNSITGSMHTDPVPRPPGAVGSPPTDMTHLNPTSLSRLPQQWPSSDPHNASTSNSELGSEKDFVRPTVPPAKNINDPSNTLELFDVGGILGASSSGHENGEVARPRRPTNPETYHPSSNRDFFAQDFAQASANQRSQNSTPTHDAASRPTSAAPRRSSVSGQGRRGSGAIPNFSSPFRTSPRIWQREHATPPTSREGRDEGGAGDIQLSDAGGLLGTG